MLRVNLLSTYAFYLMEDMVFVLKCSNQFNNVITDIKHATTSNIAKKTKMLKNYL